MTLATIGRFEVERPLGSGSFATVWLARDVDLDAPVAIKLLAENWSLNADARRRFLEEARAMRRLDDERIVRVYEVGHLPDGRPYMAMEFADRGTLEDRMRLRAHLGQPFSVEEAVDLSVRIAECLAAVHGHRMVHRDVKPSNVLFRTLPREHREALRRAGRPDVVERTLLGDFGIVRHLEGLRPGTMVLGTPPYMAPEQGDPARADHVDERSDLYSAAVVLHELLTGAPPPRSSFDTTAGSGSSSSVGRVTIPTTEPRALSDLVARGLAPDPRDRFASAWEWRHSLLAAMAAQGPPRAPAVSVLTPAVSAGTVARAPGLSVGAPPARPGSGAVATVPGRRPSATDPLPPPSSPPSAPSAARPGRVRVPPVDLRVPGILVMVASFAAVLALVLPLSNDALASAFSASSAAMTLAGLLLLGGLGMWRTRRRWLAVLCSGMAMLAGAAQMLVALYGFFTLGRSGVPALGPGLWVLLGAGALGCLAGRAAIARLREHVLPWDRSLASRPG